MIVLEINIRNNTSSMKVSSISFWAPQIKRSLNCLCQFIFLHLFITANEDPAQRALAEEEYKEELARLEQDG